MPSTKLTLAVCENFLPEAKAVLAQNGLPAVNLISWKPCCEHPPKNWDNIVNLLGVQDTDPLLIIGACFPRELQQPPEHLSHMHIHHLEQCFHLLHNKTQVETLINEGSYLISPAWLANWQKHLEQWGFDHEHAQLFFSDTAKKIVLLDTGIFENTLSNVEKFANYIGLPYTKIDIGLDFINYLLRALIFEWQDSVQKKTLANHQEQAANYALALSLLNELSDKDSKDEAAREIETFFKTLFAPKYTKFSFYEETTTGDSQKKQVPDMQKRSSICCYNLDGFKKYIIHDSGDGFCLSLQTKKQHIGCLDIFHLAFPQNLERYLNLALHIAPLCALVINRAQISEKLKKKMVELTETSEKLSEVQHIAKLGSWELDLAKNVHSWSAEVGRIFALEQQQFHATYEDFLKKIHPDDRDYVNRVYTESVQNKKPYDVLYRLLMDDGTLKYINARCRTFYNSDGKPIRSIGTVQDVTEGILIEQHQDLEKQLLQKHKMEAIGYMAGGMAHNFNNNLSIILGNVELAQIKLAGNPEVIPLLKNATTAILRSRDLIKQLLIYSRKGIQNKAPIQLATIINETVDLLRSTLPTTVSLESVSSPGYAPIFIYADASQIQEVVINLCNNAVQAMDEQGTVKISIAPAELISADIPAEYDANPGRYAKLSVQDTGCGIATETIDKIFDPFFTTKGEYEGAGMGLATVQGIVAQHDGIIKVDSVPNRGTVFNLYFPITDAVATETKSPDNSMPEGTEQILLIDDDPMLATLGEQMLTAMGYQVTMMTDSMNALKLFTANPDNFDLVITDQTMPELSGKDLIQKLKKIKIDIPTILYTGFSNQIDEELAKELGISAFLMKPLNMSTLSQTVRSVLDGARG